MTDFPRHSGGSWEGNRVGSECPSVSTLSPRPASTSGGSGGSAVSVEISGRGRGQVQERGRLWGSKSGSRSMIEAASVAEFSFLGSIRGVGPPPLSVQRSLPPSLAMPPPRGEASRARRHIPASPQKVANFPPRPRTLAPKLSLPHSFPIVFSTTSGQPRSSFRDTTCNLRLAKTLFLQPLSFLLF
uniref:Uncharacterized protein n=1 Tax=Mustela putorius furo TaxID=9669 RepID=M3XZU7_MUSPF